MQTERENNVNANLGAQVFDAGTSNIFVDLDGDGCIGENDKTIIGNPNPDIYGSWTNM